MLKITTRAINILHKGYNICQFGRAHIPLNTRLAYLCFVYKMPYRRAPRLTCRLFSLKAECVARAKVSCIQTFVQPLVRVRARAKVSYNNFKLIEGSFTIDVIGLGGGGFEIMTVDDRGDGFFC